MQRIASLLRASLLVAPAVFALIVVATPGCGSGDDPGTNPTPTVDGDVDAGPDSAPDTKPDGGPDGDAAPDTTPDGSPDAPPAGPLSVERWGARVWGPIKDVRRIGRELWIGTTGVDEPSTNTAAAPPVRAGLYRLSIDDGTVKHFEAELPRFDYGGFGATGTGAMPTATVVAIGDRRVVLTRTGLVSIAGDVVTDHPLKASDGSDVVPIALAADATRGVLWVGTESGLLKIDATTFATTATIGEKALGGERVISLAIDPATGAAFAAVQNPTGTRLVRVLGETVTSSMIPGEDGAPAGAVSAVAWSARHAAAYAVLTSFATDSGGVVRWDGTTATSIANEGELSTAARGKSVPFGAAALAYDEDDDVLVIGGRLRSVLGGAMQGGGLAWIHLATRPEIIGYSTDTGLSSDHVASLAYDPLTKRTYAALLHPCSEHKLGVDGVVALSFKSDSTLRIERPILSGVRALARVDGVTYAALRDDAPGNACEGVAVQNGLVKLLANHAGELVPLKPGKAASDGSDLRFDTFRAGLNVLAVRDSSHFALGGWKWETYFGAPTDGLIANPALDFGVSLFPNDIAWAGPTTLWIGGRILHDPSDGTEPIADLFPRGAALITLKAGGEFGSATRYVRTANKAGDVPGLPSSEVNAIALAADGTAYLVCGTERYNLIAYDHGPRASFPEGGPPRLGGIARIAPDGTLTVLATGDVIPDGTGGALDDAGRLIVLDAQKGLFRLEGGKLVARTLPTAIPSGLRAKSLWVGAGDDLVASYDGGASVSLGGATKFVDRVGEVWRTLQRANGVVYLGADEGIARVSTKDAKDEGETTPATGALPSFTPIRR